MADKDFRIDLILGAKFAEAFRALDGAKRKIEDVDKSAGNLSRRAGTSVGSALRVSATAAVAAATAATAVMGLYIAKTIEAEKVQAQLASRVKDTAGAAGRSLASLNEQAGKLQSITVFDDEAIGNAQAMLLTFTQIRGVNFDRTIDSALDLATHLGIDVADAAKILGKALDDPIKGLGVLSKAGVTFTADERERIKTMVEAGQVAEAQGLILDKLAGKMGTAAEAARDTLGGSLQALKNSFDNLLEGDTGDEGIVGTRDAIESLIDTLNDPATKQGFDNIVSGLASAASAAVNALAQVANFTRFVAEEVASRSGGPTGDDVVRIEQTIGRLKKEYTAGGGLFGDAPDPISKLLGLKTTQGNAERFAEIKRLEAMRDAYRAAEDERARLARWGNVIGGSPSTYDALANPKPEGQGVASPAKGGKPGKTADPDADIKRRIESLREEAALLGAVTAGEERASEAAKVRYAITEGEFKKKSPQLQQELLQAAEALDAKNADVEAEKKRRDAIKESEDAYKALRLELRTPAEVAVDEAIAKLNTLNAALKNEQVSPEQAKQDAARVVDQSLEKAPDFRSPYEGFDDPTGILGDAALLDAASARLEAWRTAELEKLRAYREKGELTEMEFNTRVEDMDEEHARKRSEIKLAERQMQVNATQLIFDSMTSIMRSATGEQSKAYRAMFAVSKGFAIATAALKLGEAIANASAMPWPANIPLIAAAFAQGAQVASMIASVAYSGGAGYAEGGYTGPGGKYQPAGIVHKGEGVLSQEEISALGGPAGFYRLRALIDEGAMRERMYGWAGYAAGGLVGESGPVLAPPDYASYPQGAAGLTSNVSNNMRVALYQDIDKLRQDILNHPDAERLIVARVSENGQTVRASWD